jgi:hypothetical protein
MCIRSFRLVSLNEEMRLTKSGNLSSSAKAEERRVGLTVAERHNF